MENLQNHINLLKKIIILRKQNEELRFQKLQKIQIIDKLLIQINLKTFSISRNFQYNSVLTGLNLEDQIEIYKLFYGKSKNSNFDSNLLDSKIKDNFKNFNYEQKYFLFSNQQFPLSFKLAYLNKTENIIKFESLLRLNIHPFENNLSFHDKIRVIFIEKLFNNIKNLIYFYPHISLRKALVFNRKLINQNIEINLELLNEILKIFNQYFPNKIKIN